MFADKSIPGTASLVFAITGHRDLRPADAPRFEAEIRRIFANAHERYPNTPLLLLSGLAEGADTIAVRAAIAEAVPYLAILPMPAHLYRRDFATNPGAIKEFEELLHDAARIIELPRDPDSTLEEISQPGKHRDRQYEHLGRFLVQYSQILIAIWDDNRTVKAGGTAQVVSMKLREQPQGGRLAFMRKNINGAGPVYVLPARRISSGSGTPPALDCDARYPESSSREDYEASYKLLDRFNGDVRGAGRYFPEAVRKSRLDLFEGAEAIGLSEAMQWVATVYAAADSLAIHFSAVSLLIWKAVFLLLALSGVALAGLHSGGGKAAMLSGYYGCLLFAVVLILLEWYGKRRGRHEDYRALAEALRVQFFWMAAGLPDLAADQYLRKQAGEMVWIRDAISECGLYEGVLDRSHIGRRDVPLRLRLAHNWVTGQAAFFSKTKRRHETKKLALTIFASAAASVGLVAPLFADAIAALALWWAALAWNYIERRGFEQEARQYERMYHLFHDADEDLTKFERQQNFDAAEETIRELGREALAENGDWLSMHRERKLSVHMAAG